MIYIVLCRLNTKAKLILMSRKWAILQSKLMIWKIPFKNIVEQNIILEYLYDHCKKSLSRANSHVVKNNAQNKNNKITELLNKIYSLNDLWIRYVFVFCDVDLVYPQHYFVQALISHFHLPVNSPIIFFRNISFQCY